MTREGITLSPATVAAIGRAEGRGRRGRTVAVWIIAATFIGVLLAVQHLQ